MKAKILRKIVDREKGLELKKWELLWEGKLGIGVMNDPAALIDEINLPDLDKESMNDSLVVLKLFLHEEWPAQLGLVEPEPGMYYKTPSYEFPGKVGVISMVDRRYQDNGAPVVVIDIEAMRAPLHDQWHPRKNTTKVLVELAREGIDFLHNMRSAEKKEKVIKPYPSFAASASA